METLKLCRAASNPNLRVKYLYDYPAVLNIFL